MAEYDARGRWALCQLPPAVKQAGHILHGSVAFTLPVSIDSTDGGGGMSFRTLDGTRDDNSNNAYYLL